MPMTTPAANALPDTPCYLNGDFSTLRNAKVSVLDRGFIFGDGIYEGVPAYVGKLFRFEQHMAPESQPGRIVHHQPINVQPMARDRS